MFLTGHRSLMASLISGHGDKLRSRGPSSIPGRVSILLLARFLYESRDLPVDGSTFHRVEYTPPSSAEVKNVWSCASTLPQGGAWG
jgi:hypothetical protein